MTVAVLAGCGYPTPCLALALHAPGYAVAACAAVAGAASAISGTYYSTVLQQQVAPDMLARVTAFSLTGSYTLGAAGYATLSSAMVMTVPAIHRVRWREPPAQQEPLPSDRKTDGNPGR